MWEENGLNFLDKMLSTYRLEVSLSETETPKVSQSPVSPGTPCQTWKEIEKRKIEICFKIQRSRAFIYYIYISFGTLHKKDVDCEIMFWEWFQLWPPPCLVPYLNPGMSYIGFSTFSFVSVQTFCQIFTYSIQCQFVWKWLDYKVSARKSWNPSIAWNNIMGSSLSCPAYFGAKL